jgi:hypothetical protein
MGHVDRFVVCKLVRVECRLGREDCVVEENSMDQLDRAQSELCYPSHGYLCLEEEQLVVLAQLVLVLVALLELSYQDLGNLSHCSSFDLGSSWSCICKVCMASMEHIVGMSSMTMGVVVLVASYNNFHYLLRYNMMMNILERTSTKLGMENMNIQCTVSMDGKLLEL